MNILESKIKKESFNRQGEHGVSVSQLNIDINNTGQRN